MRYTGPVKQEVAKGGEFLISRARVLLGQVEDRLRRTPMLQQLTARAETGDGWKIWVGNILGRRFIEITGNVGELIEGVCKVEYLSGFMDWINPFTYGADGHISRVSLRDQETGAVSGWENSEELLPAFGGAGTGTSCSPFFQQFRATPAIQKSSCYSGEMMNIIALLQGYKLPIAFNYCWGETDGIWVSGYGVRYVIRISIVEGVTAWKLPVCEELSEERKDELGLDYPFLPKPVTTIPPLASRILLMSSREMVQSGYPATYPYSFELGWSFSPDGHKAIQTSWSWPDAWKRAHLWEMDITSYDGTEPHVATLTKTEESYCWGEPWGNIKFPQYLPTGGMSLVTFDPRSDPVLAGAPPGDYSRIPYFAAYLPGNDTPMVWRTSDASTPDDEDPYDNAENPANYHQCSAERWTMKAPGVGAGVFGTGLVKNYSMKRFFEATGPVSNPVEPEVSFTASGSMRIYSTVQDGGWYQNGSTLRAISQHWTSTTESFNPGKHAKLVYSTISVPFFNRCGLHLFVKMREDVWSESATQFKDGMGFGQYQFYKGHIGFQELCDGNFPQYRPIPCNGFTEPLIDLTEFWPYGSGWWCSEPKLKAMFTPGDGCYGEPDAPKTQYWCRTGATPSPLSTCAGVATNLTGYYKEIASEQHLYALNWETGEMEQVKEWTGPGSYDPYDPYMAEQGYDGGQIMVSHFEPFRLKGFNSMEMNGIRGDKYVFVNNPQAKYPVLSDIEGGLDRTFFGVSFRTGE